MLSASVHLVALRGSARTAVLSSIPALTRRATRTNAPCLVYPRHPRHPRLVRLSFRGCGGWAAPRDPRFAQPKTPLPLFSGGGVLFGDGWSSFCFTASHRSE